MREPRLLLAEDERHVVDMVARGWGDGQDRWVALGPSAMAALEARKVTYQIPEDFHDWAEVRALCEDLHRRVEKLCHVLDERLLRLQPDLDRSGFRPFQFHVFPLMILFDSLGSRIFQLDRILRAYPEYQPVAHARPPQQAGAFDILFSSDETLWGRVAALSGSHRVVETLPDQAPSSRASVLERVKCAIGRSVTLTSIARHLVGGEYPAALRSLFPRRNVVLVMEAPDEWSAVLPKLRKVGLQSVFASERFFGASYSVTKSERSIDDLAADELKDLFVVAGVSFYRLVAGRLGTIWRDGPSGARAAVRRFGDLQRRYRVRALLRTSAATGTGHNVNQAARVRGIPVFVWQHGMITRRPLISQFREYTDMMTADFVLAYGDESARGYGQFRERWPATRVIAVGSSQLERFRSRQPKATVTPRRILYATTNYLRNNWYLGYAPGLSDRWLYRDQVAIISSLAEAAREGLCRAKVKLHPSDLYPIPPWVATLERAANVEIVRGSQSDFRELLDWSEGVVLDFPSTTLLQSLAARRPTFVLLRHCRPSPEAEHLLFRSAVAFESTEDLCAELGEFLLTGAFRADPHDDAFVRACGAHLDDGASTDRAFGLLAEALEWPRRRGSSHMAEGDSREQSRRR